MFRALDTMTFTHAGYFGLVFHHDEKQATESTLWRIWAPSTILRTRACYVSAIKMIQVYKRGGIAYHSK